MSIHQHHITEEHHSTTEGQQVCSKISPLPKEIPLYSFDQLLEVCLKKIEEREDFIRAEYESILSRILAERYETFTNDSSNFTCQMELDADYLS